MGSAVVEMGISIVNWLERSFVLLGGICICNVVDSYGDTPLVLVDVEDVDGEVSIEASLDDGIVG